MSGISTHPLQIAVSFVSLCCPCDACSIPVTYYYVGLSGEYIWSVCLSIGLLVCLIGLVYLASLVCLVVLVCLSGWSGLLVCLVYLVGLSVCLMVGWSFGLSLGLVFLVCLLVLQSVRLLPVDLACLVCLVCLVGLVYLVDLISLLVGQSILPGQSGLSCWSRLCIDPYVGRFSIGLYVVD